MLVLLLFRDALNDIFDMCDLTGNGLWSREEFRLFNLLTSDQELDDAEWQVVEGLSLAVFVCFVDEHCTNLFLCFFHFFAIMHTSPISKLGHIYTVSQKKRRHYTLVHIFAKY